MSSTQTLSLLPTITALDKLSLSKDINPLFRMPAASLLMHESSDLEKKRV